MFNKAISGRKNEQRAAKRFLTVQLVLITLLISLAGTALAGPAWELRVCADPDNAPVSTRQLDGYENLIATILADELGATLTYVWAPTNDYAVRTLLNTGECDLMLSVGEGQSGLLNTVAYYRIPFVFVYKSATGHNLESLYDPTLSEMRIAASPNSLIHSMLLSLGLADNFHGILPDASTRGSDRVKPTINAVLRDEVDIAILPGAQASTHVAASGGVLGMSPVSPELVPPMSRMFQLATIGVRPQDEALRDTLNNALAHRWDDIQMVFDELGIPTLSSVPVVAGKPVDRARIGVIAPFPTSTPHFGDITAVAAYFGARLADDLLANTPGQQDLDLEILFASAPTADAAARAAERLISTNDILGIVGGYDDDSAAALAAVARDENVLFLNAGATAESLRNASCYPTTFHTEPSAAMYIDAMASQATNLGHENWFLIREDLPASEVLAERLHYAAALAGTALTSGFVPAGPTSYHSTIQDIAASDASVVFALLDPVDLEMFLVQAEQEQLAADVIGFPWPASQTRDFYYRLSHIAPNSTGIPRIASWDATLKAYGASEINLRFTSRSGQPMDSAGWSTFAAIEILANALAATGARETAVLIDHLTAEDTILDVIKGPGTSFRVWDHQLRQPLYLVQIDSDAPWNDRVTERIAIASVAAQLPPLDEVVYGDSREALDRFGADERSLICE